MSMGQTKWERERYQNGSNDMVHIERERERERERDQNGSPEGNSTQPTARLQQQGNENGELRAGRNPCSCRVLSEGNHDVRIWSTTSSIFTWINVHHPPQ